MQEHPTIRILATALTAALLCAGAHAAEPDNVFKLGVGRLNFSTASEDLAGEGPAANFTPPGIHVTNKNTEMLLLRYERRLTDQWSFLLHVAMPPLVKMEGAGTIQGAGTIGTTRAVSPAVFAAYRFVGVPVIQPYVALGVNYTHFTDEEVRPVYTNAFQGASSTLKLKSSWGPAFHLGLEYPIGKDWVADLSYLHYRIKTTATFTTVTPTPGGNIDLVRTSRQKVNPDIFALSVGYRF